MEIATALTGISHGMNILRSLKDASEALGDAETKFKIAELTGALADAKVALAEAQSALDVLVPTEVGHRFRNEVGHRFRFEAGHLFQSIPATDSDLKSATPG